MLSVDYVTQATLKKEIQNLQQQLQDQFLVRQMLEKAVSQKRYVCDAQSSNCFPKEAENLIKEIAVLELEVAYLERYVLSLCRRRFAHHRDPEDQDSASGIERGENITRHGSCPSLPRHPTGSPPEECNLIRSTLRQSDTETHRSQSSLSHRSLSCSNRIIPPVKSPAECDGTFHSLPLSMLEQAQCSRSNMTNLEQHLLVSVSDPGWETPNRISEEMIKSISGIYCELAEPPLMANHYFPCSSSPSSSGQNETWGHNNKFSFSTFNSNFCNPFNINHSRESGLETDVVEVRSISCNRERLKNVEYMLRKYRSLVNRLRQVDPSKMKQEEKLAFWINVHNSLGMHAILVHRNPNSKLKRTASLLKAEYDVGGHAISLDLIRNIILQCKLLLPVQWLRLFLPSRRNSKGKDVPKSYAIDFPEHLLPFSLSSGSYSDPVVRVYKPEKVFKELKAAREEYLQSNISFHKDKVLIPKLVQNYAKGSGLSTGDLLGIVLCNSTEPGSHFSVRKSHQKRKTSKLIEWIPHSFNFRYLLSSELA